jgi:hypothetical protein
MSFSKKDQKSKLKHNFSFLNPNRNKNKTKNYRLIHHDTKWEVIINTKFIFLF